MDISLKKRIKAFKNDNKNSSISVELNQADNNLARISAIILVEDKQAAKYDYCLPSKDLSEKYDSVVTKAVSEALDLAGYFESAESTTSKASSKAPQTEKNAVNNNESSKKETGGERKVSDEKELLEAGSSVLTKLQKLKKIALENSKSEQKASEEETSMYDDTEIEEDDAVNEVEPEEDDEPDSFPDDLIDSEEIPEPEKPKENIPSETIISMFENNPNSHAIIARFDSNNFLDMLSGEIKEAYSYVTNYRNYKGMTLAEIDEKNPMLIKWFAIPQKKKEELYPEETKYCKIIVDWKERNHIK